MPVFDIYDNKPNRRILADFERVSIGRTPDNTISVDDRLASRYHCEIRRSAAGFILADLKSRNGTCLNQAPLDRPTALRNGDEIGIGSASIRFWINPEQINPAAPKLPMIKAASAPANAPQPLATLPDKPDTSTKRPQHRPNLAHVQKSEETVEFAPDQLRLAESDLPPAAFLDDRHAGPLTTEQVIPLNCEGKPAHPVGRDATEVSHAMMCLKELLLKALQLTATDVHFEPREDHWDIRYRVDGFLHQAATIYSQDARPVYSIIKLLCNLDITKRGIMADGSFAVQLPDRRVDIRVSIAPSTRGDKVVLRLLDKKLAPQGLDSLGMDPYILDQVRRFAQLESSMILVCGPTGSGKTTSVYALLQEMNHLTKNIVTVEDPVEYKLEHVTQIQVNPHADVTFVSALRSLLRQDPDIILIGEIRDPETAHLAVRSAMTGHAVLSTVHARDSIGCILRLLDLGVEPFLLASALTAVLSQRLLRKLCEHCKMRFRPAARLLTQNHLEELVGQELYSAVGCSHCMGIGYRGRLPIFEMLPISDQLREAISKKPGVQELRIAGGDWIRQTLREDAVRKIRDGLTSIDEFAHLSGRD